MYNVLPLDDWRIERFNSDIAGRPVLVKGNAQLLCEGMTRTSESSVLSPPMISCGWPRPSGSENEHAPVMFTAVTEGSFG